VARDESLSVPLRGSSPGRPRRVTAALRGARHLPWLPILFLCPLFIWGIFGPWLYPHDPTQIDLSRALQPPGFAGGDWSYFLGTDQMGRDLLSQLMLGARASLLVALFGVVFSGIVGIGLGSLAGYFGGKADSFIMRIVDAWMAIPNTFLVLMLVAVMRQLHITGLLPIIIAIAVTMWVPYAVVARGETLKTRQADYVRLARVTGCKNKRIMVRHVWPNVTNSLIVITTAQLGAAIMAEAGMSFLGVGVQPPSTAWGLLIAQSISYMSSAWWVPTFAGICITITVLGANLLGDWLRDTLDPTLRRTGKVPRRPAAGWIDKTDLEAGGDE
jgi:peptide/nickel transport system permease protein